MRRLLEGRRLFKYEYQMVRRSFEARHLLDEVRYILSSKYWNNEISPTPWKLVSCSIKQYQFFLNTKGPWDTERLLCKSELTCFDKRRFAVNLTNYTWRVKKLHVILIFTVRYH